MKTTLNWFYDQRDKTTSAAQGHLCPALLPDSAPAGQSRGKNHQFSNPWARCRDPGLPGRHGLLLRFPHRRGAALRLHWMLNAETSPKPLSERSGTTRRSSSSFVTSNSWKANAAPANTMRYAADAAPGPMPRGTTWRRSRCASINRGSKGGRSGKLPFGFVQGDGVGQFRVCRRQHYYPLAHETKVRQIPMV
jgi:hypothetical protein